MIEHKVVDSVEVGRMLALAESHFLDLKRVEISPAKLSESISAFANTAGGELFVGMGETANGRFWRGFSKMEDANGLFAVLERMSALQNHYSGTFLTASGEDGTCCIL